MTPLRMQLMTDRLRLRPWRPDDREPFAALCADPVVMEHFPAPMDRAECDERVDRIEAGFAERGWDLWAVERKDTGAFAGFTGLLPAPDSYPGRPAVEIGWRLAREHWGAGFAPEAARAVLSFAFQQLKLAEVVAVTTEGNTNSRRVMEKLGMARDPEADFVDPRYPEWPHLLVLYRLRASEWRRHASTEATE